MSIIINEISNEILREAAKYADNKKNGGNGNGVLDSNEETIFTRKAAESFSDRNVVSDYAKLLGYDVQKNGNNVNKKSNNKNSNIKRVNYSKLSYAELNKRYNMLKKVKEEINKKDIYEKNENRESQSCSTTAGVCLGAIGGLASYIGVAEAAVVSTLAASGIGLLVFGAAAAIGYGAPRLYQHYKNESRKDDLKYIFDVNNEEDLRNIIANIDDIDFELKMMEEEIKARQVENRANSLAELGK